MHLVIYFCGARNSGNDFLNGYDINDPSIKTIFVEGCHHSEVCNSILFPDLKSFAERFVHTLFENRGEYLGLKHVDLARLKLGINTHEEYSYTHNGEPVTRKKTTVTAEDAREDITSISLAGFNRGALTAFEVAPLLENLAPKLEIDIIANQPVSGNAYQLPGSQAVNIADCSHCNNIRHVSVIIEAYAESLAIPDADEPYHRVFFTQITPLLPDKAIKNLIVIPRESHQVRENSADGEEHLNMELAKSLRKRGFLTQEIVVRKTLTCRRAASFLYQQLNPSIPPLTNSDLSNYFGIKKEPVQYKAHGNTGLRKGYELHHEESLIDWWERQDKKVSHYSTLLTQLLVKNLKSMDLSNPDALKELYKETDTWLILKTNFASSRYAMVEALRHHIGMKLIALGVEPKELATIVWENMHETNYFLSEWNKTVKNANYFRTKQTRDLEEAIHDYAGELPTRENAEKLLGILDQWLHQENAQSNKRFDLVIIIREQLEEAVRAAHGVLE
ncbi:hypothetical protein [Legionella quinlivanii]|uniref:hypothetical protein n=1 Tax=Legionella quinlivanii TaxID=45073 RepID=UPI000730FC1F|nr:hypothetical protein [Legionella quinlivanii]STY11573.1 Uncharacterised protein [Legionella quinlivanii]